LEPRRGFCFFLLVKKKLKRSPFLLVAVGGFFVTFLMGKKVTKKPTPCIQKSVPASPKMVQKPLTPVFDFHFSLGSTTIFE
jgi:hypothetical protein